MSSDLRERIEAGFRREFSARPAWIVRAPGRVNLIGEHTDYNDGYVLPVAIDRAVWIALRPRRDRLVVLHSLDFGERLEFDLDALQKQGGWGEYVRGVAWALQRDGLPLRGWEGVLAGDVPRGAGLSSSAALELAAARAFAAASDLTWEPARMAALCWRAEVEWVGLNCGIMDQMAAAAARAGHALWLDCRTVETRDVPLPAQIAVVVLDTGTRRGLVGTAYNQRHEQCLAAARFFGVPALRDVSLETFHARSGEMDDLPRRRARHVITENERVLQAVVAMQAGDLATLGRLLNESHASLRDDFEVSSPALDQIVAAAQAHPGCLGARMTGAGFGGCAVALVGRESVADFIPAVSKEYRSASGKEASVYVCAASQGASVENV